jgi:glycogen debranching enzyme
MGPFLTAYIKVNGDSDAVRRQAADWLAPLKDHLSDAGLGHISEIFDGDEPQRPVGCVAQAWSVAEVLRTYSEDVKGIRPAPPAETKPVIAPVTQVRSATRTRMQGRDVSSAGTRG